MVRLCGTAYLPICGNHKLLLLLNPAAGTSFLMINKLTNHTAFMKSRQFVIVFILLLLDLISSRKYLNNVINAILVITLSPDVLSMLKK